MTETEQQTITQEQRDAVTNVIDQWIMGGRPQTGHVDVCLAGDVRDEHDAIVDESNELDRRRLALVADRKDADEAATTMAERAGVRSIDEQLAGLIEEQNALQARLEAVKDRMRAATRVVHMRALDPTAYRRLQLEHPPLDDDEHDQASGVHVDTFWPALVAASTTHLTTLDSNDELPAPTAEQWTRAQSVMSSLQWDRVWGLAHSLNRRELTIPKSSRRSAATPS